MKRIFVLFLLLISSSICALADEVIDVKLPPDYKIIVKNQDFPVTLRPLVKNGTFRVVNYQLVYKNKVVDNIVDKVQIMDRQNIVYEYKYSEGSGASSISFNGWAESHVNNEQGIGERYYKHLVVHGKDKDYLMFMITYPNGNPHYPSYLLGYDKDNSKIILYSDWIPGDLRLLNPRNNNGEYELIDDRYINVPRFDGFFLFTLQFEIKDNSIKLVEKEYEILHYNTMPFFPGYKEISIYSKPSIKSNVYKIKVNDKSTVKILGIRFTEDNNFVHVIINGKEGWIEEMNSQYIGIGPAIGG